MSYSRRHENIPPKDDYIFYNRLFVLGGKGLTEEDWKRHFSEFGRVTRVKITLDKNTGNEKGWYVCSFLLCWLFRNGIWTFLCLQADRGLQAGSMCYGATYVLVVYQTSVFVPLRLNFRASNACALATCAEDYCRDACHNYNVLEVKFTLRGSLWNRSWWG